MLLIGLVKAIWIMTLRVIIFDKEEIIDSDYMDFHFDMCDVGDDYGDPDRYDDEER